MKAQTTLKLLLKIVTKEGTSGAQEDSTKGQKCSSWGADWKSHVVGQVSMMWTWSSLGEPLQSWGLWGANALRDIRDKAGEKIWVCRTEDRIHFLLYSVPPKRFFHAILEHKACLRACCPSPQPFGWDKISSWETQLRQRCWNKVGNWSGGATGFKKAWDWNT